MKKTLTIAFSGGAYGTYLEWVLNTMMFDDDIVRPFTTTGSKKGNSHNSKFGNHLLDMNGWRNYRDSDQDYLTARFHPKTIQHESLVDNLNELLDCTEKTILLYPDTEHELLCINNYMTKIWTGDLYKGPLKDINLDLIYENFPVSRDVDPENIPRWIKREHLSFYMMDAFRSQLEWFLPDHWSNERCLVIFVSDLLHNFESTVEKIFLFWNKTPKKKIESMISYHHEMLDLQVNLGQDQTCDQIIKSIEKNVDTFEWEPLPLASESWIQWKLREKGFEIRCHDLDIFPTTTKKLSELLYKI